MAGSVMLVGFVLAVSAVDNRAQDLEASGARVSGSVISTRGAGEHGVMRVSYVWLGVTRVGTVHLDASSSVYQVGEPVTVLVDARDLSHMTVEGETNQSPKTVLPMIVLLLVGAMAALVGGCGVGRARRQRRVLRKHSWEQYRLTQMSKARWQIEDPTRGLRNLSSPVRQLVMRI
ncbi:MAG TPA: DUF3592 domain-containing protein [Acidimicrobiales bacterium]|nr:DUF3592 domain-containing protein [Acidimicrobiales bacterium]